MVQDRLPHGVERPIDPLGGDADRMLCGWTGELLALGSLEAGVLGAGLRRGAGSAVAQPPNDFRRCNHLPRAPPPQRIDGPQQRIGERRRKRAAFAALGQPILHRVGDRGSLVPPDHACRALDRVRVAEQLLEGVGLRRAHLQGEQVALDSLQALVRLLTGDLQELGVRFRHASSTGVKASKSASTRTIPTSSPLTSAAPARYSDPPSSWASGRSSIPSIPSTARPARRSACCATTIHSRPPSFSSPSFAARSITGITWPLRFRTPITSARAPGTGGTSPNSATSVTASTGRA